MKQLAILFLSLSALTFAQEKEVPLSEVHEILDPLNDATSFIIKVEKGDELPIHFRMSGDVLDLGMSSVDGTIKAKEPLYIKIEPSFLFSEDKESWKPFETYFTGELGASLSGEIAPLGEFFLRLNKR